MDKLVDDNIFEISLIGTGGGYGESIVIHLGSKEWIVIDSCIDPKTNKSLPLELLRLKGVDIANDVKLIICTHWHDDHIRGISDLLENCINARFCMAKATDTGKFLQLVGLDHYKAKVNATASSTKELANCLKIIEERKIPIKGAEQDKLLYSVSNIEHSTNVFSLSPSDLVIDEFNGEISQLITDYGQTNRKIINNTPNEKSVAIYIAFNNHSVILGSDLELSENKLKGWKCIVDNCSCINSKSSLFKIPHHGSSNAYFKDVWDNLLIGDTLANITPWNRGGKLPTKEMLLKYLSHTKELYVTSPIGINNKPKKRDRDLQKAIYRFNKSLYEVKFDFGVIQCRHNINQKNTNWDIELIGKALKVLQ